MLREVLDNGVRKVYLESNTVYLFVLTELVIGKSTGPKGFARYKPVPYSNADQPHIIVYASQYEGNSADAASRAVKSYREVANSSRVDGKIYEMNIMVHDIAANQVVYRYPATAHPGLIELMYDGSTSSGSIATVQNIRLLCNNANLSEWKILTPALVSQAVNNYNVARGVVKPPPAVPPPPSQKTKNDFHKELLGKLKASGLKTTPARPGDFPDER